MADGYGAEAVWLKSFLEIWSGDVFFTSDVEQQMRQAGISRVDILNAMKVAHIDCVKNLNRSQSIWVMKGRTCDDESFQLELSVDVNIYRLEVENVRRIKVDKGEGDGEMQEMRFKGGRIPDAS